MNDIKKSENQVGHTPGPWKHDASRDQIYSDSEDYKFSLICKIASGENRKEEDANARLIAAAPELLEACKLTLEKAERSDITGHMNLSISLREVNLLTAAIAKAEGRKL